MRLAVSTRRTIPVAATVLLASLLAAPAFAHTGVHDVAGFGAGLSHPLSGLDHLLAMVAVGLLAARWGTWSDRRSDGRALWMVPALFVGGMVAGSGLGMVGTDLPLVEAGIVGSVILLGLIVGLGPQFEGRPFAGRRALALGIAGLVAVSGAVHGHAHGAEMPEAGSALLYAAGFLAATAALHALGIAAALGLGRTLASKPAAIAVRSLGVVIGTAGLALAAGL